MGDGWGNNIFHDTAKFFHELTLFKIALLCLSVAKFTPSRTSVSKKWLIVDYCQILKGRLQLQKHKTRSGFLDINKKSCGKQSWMSDKFNLSIACASWREQAYLDRTSGQSSREPHSSTRSCLFPAKSNIKLFHYQTFMFFFKSVPPGTFHRPGREDFHASIPGINVLIMLQWLYWKTVNNLKM